MATNEQNINKSGTERKALIITLVVALLGGGFLFYGNSKLKNENQIFSMRVDSLQLVKNEIEEQLALSNNKIDEYRSEIGKRDSRINKYEAEIDKKEKRIKTLIAEGASLKKLRKESRELKKLSNDLLDRISVLEKRNADLISQNEGLTRENSELKIKLTDLEGRYAVMEKKVKVASVLRVDEVTITTQKKDKKGNYIDVRKAKRADRLLINFVINENRVADKGSKVFYIRIFDPKNKLVETSGSGSFTNEEGNISTPYTKSEKISYANNKKQKISVPVELGDTEPVKGTYKIEVYEDGNYSGSGSVNLR